MAGAHGKKRWRQVQINLWMHARNFKVFQRNVLQNMYSGQMPTNVAVTGKKKSARGSICDHRQPPSTNEKEYSANACLNTSLLQKLSFSSVCRPEGERAEILRGPLFATLKT